MKKKTWFINLKENPVMSSILATIALISTLGGAVWSLGDRPPWASVERVAQIEQAMMRTRYSQVLGEIYKLQQIAKVRRLTPIEQQYLQSLETERRILACQLRIGPCQ